MSADLAEKTDRYDALLAEALSAADVAEGEATPSSSDNKVDGRADGNADESEAPGGEACLEMARSYLEDGRHFRERDDLVNALAAFSYGHGWLDAGARLGALDVPTEGHLFTE